MDQKKSDTSRMAVVGGGPSGLLSAYYAVRAGQPPSSITVYEARERTGGHAGSQEAANHGPEFIDSRHRHLIALAKELKVELEPSTDQQAVSYQRPNGKPMSAEAFNKAYQPLQALIREDKERAATDAQFARELDAMSLEQYLHSLADRAEKERVSKRTYAGYFNEMMPWSARKSLDPDITQIVAQAYASEVGQAPASANALQFMREASVDCDEQGLPIALLQSDCAYRVKGGMEELYARLRERLEKEGVEFRTGTMVRGISKDKDGIVLDTSEGNQRAARVVMAVPAHVLPRLKGLGALGMEEAQLEQAAQLQYTQNAKFTVRLKEGVQLPEEALYSALGYQSWMRPGEGTVTFLVGSGMMEGRSGKALVAKALEDFAKAHGKRVDQLFDTAEGSVVFNQPGAQNACYPSPAPGQLLALDALKASNARLATQGVVLVGNYLPQSEGIGFMENAAESAQAAQQMLRGRSGGRQASVPAMRRSAPSVDVG